MYNRICEYTIRLEKETIERKYPFHGDDMTLEIQTFIDDVNSICMKMCITVYKMPNTFKK